MSRQGALRAAAGAIAVGRIAAGAPLVARPPLIARHWIGPQEAGRRSAQTLARGLGGREIALGAGLLASLALGESPRLWLAAGAGGDLGDLAGTLLAGDALPETGRRATIALAGASAVAALAIAAAVD